MIWQMRAFLLSLVSLIGIMSLIHYLDGSHYLCLFIVLPLAILTAFFAIWGMCSHFDPGIVQSWSARNAELSKFVADKSLESGISEAAILENSAELAGYKQICENRAKQLNVPIENILKMDREREMS